MTAVCAVGERIYGVALGDGTTTDRSSPSASDVLTGVKAIAGGRTSICALMDTGGVRCWGSNAFGALGDGTMGTMMPPSGSTTGAWVLKRVLSPPMLDLLTGVDSISGNGNNYCVIM